MHSAIEKMLEKYSLSTTEDMENALREILQEIILLGLWRSKFFEHAAFYGGTALRVLYGLDRFSEDMDFSLINSDALFSLKAYSEALQRELRSFGFEVSFHSKEKTNKSAIDSAFLKGNTIFNLIEIGAPKGLLKGYSSTKLVKIKLEIDTAPPGDFQIDSKFLLQPIPFAVRVFSLPDMFAGKMHAILCRKWTNRVKGRDWYDLVWFIANYPELRINHLEDRMRQSGDYLESATLTTAILQNLLMKRIETLDVKLARRDVLPFIKDSHTLKIWSREFFSSIVERIITV